MPELVVTTRTFWTVIDFWQFGFWNRCMFLQDWSKDYRNLMIVIINSWIVTVCPSAPRERICSPCHSFPFLFWIPQTRHFISNHTIVSRKEERLPYRDSWSMFSVVSGVKVAYYLTLYVLFWLIHVLCCVFSWRGFDP